MPDAIPSSPACNSTSSDEALAYYKAQYEQLEIELTEFQASSRELELELEKDIEASEKRERKLKEKVESLGYEVEEWKTKYKQAKAEASSAQNILQKEVTTLREANRALQLKLRDIEVANDDFERQARHTTSSLEDLESKYNVAIERGVLLEEEIKNGEQERESLRIETQRLRDELSDLKVETHIVQEKLRKSDMLRRRGRDFSISSIISNPRPLETLQRSPTTTATSSPSITTPPAKSVSSMNSDAVTPPSPPSSQRPAVTRKAPSTPTIQRARTSISDLKSFQKPSPQTRPARHSRGPSAPASNGRNVPALYYRRSTTNVPSSNSTMSKSGANSTMSKSGSNNTAPKSNSNNSLPKSGSLYQIRGLIGKMQKLEERVQSARSRLPAPTGTPPTLSPRASTILGQTYIPSTVTMRNARKRVSGSIVSSKDGDSTPSRMPQSRGSFGIPQSTPSRPQLVDSRPSSQTSMSSRYSASQGSGPTPIRRPESRQSFTKTPVMHSTAESDGRRSRSSFSNYNPSVMSHIDEVDVDVTTPTPRHTAINGREFVRTSIPAPGSLKKRPSVGSTASTISHGRRISSSLSRRDGEMLPPERKNDVIELGETY